MTAGPGPGDPRRGDLVEAVIEKAVYRGRGLGRVGGRVVFVPRAHPGDRVRARLTAVHAGWAEGTLVEVLDAAPERRASPCPYVPRCGGCAYQDFAYDAQLRVKEAILRESLARAGAPWDGEVAVHASPERGWRMRASLHFAPGESGPRLGLRQEGTRRVVDVLTCLQLSESMNRAARALRDAVAERPALWPHAPRPRLAGVARREHAPGVARDRSLAARGARRSPPSRASPASTGSGWGRGDGSSGCTGRRSSRRAWRE